MMSMIVIDWLQIIKVHHNKTDWFAIDLRLIVFFVEQL